MSTSSPGANGVAPAPPADQPVDILAYARALTCPWWGKHLADRTRADQKAMRKTAARAIAIVERDSGRLPESAREALALELILEMASFSMAGAKQAKEAGGALIASIPALAAALAAREEANRG